MITFTVIENTAGHGFQLLYRREEGSFDVEPKPKGCVASISVNEVELEINDQNQVLCVTGYSPFQSWRPTLLSPPDYSVGGLVVATPSDIMPGSSIGLTTVNSRWSVFFNSDGWVCIGDPSEAGDQVLAFATNCVAVLRNWSLIALWLHPMTV